jgi:hypothetical protein
MMSQSRAVGRHAEALAEAGVVVVEEYLEPERCDELREEVEALLAGDVVEARPDDDYGDLVARDEPVVKQRSGDWDDGMLDVFNVDRTIPGLAAFKEDEFVADIVGRAAGEGYAPDTVNVYVNRSVTNTRGFHADTYGGKFKSFVYLTDIPDRSFGPFAYVEGSHRPSALERTVNGAVNRIRGAPPTDAVFYDEDDVRVCTAPKGTLIVADQTGYHRGIPQDSGRERLLATTSYTPE